MLLIASFRIVVLDHGEFEVYLHHSAKWKTAKEDLDAMPRWDLNFWRRAKLRSEYRMHLEAAVDAQHRAFRIERVV
jgi:hypothetical protein